ncbi:MAG: GtrA family protein [Patescibacteria group bacterium]|nr:GtrA family protein [Patescibacteria group bacterium]
MIKKILQYALSVRHQFTKYFIVGFSGLFLDLATLIFFKEFFGLNATIAVILNQILMLTYNFLLNKYWSFKNKEMPHRQIVRYLVLAGFNYLFSVGVMYLFNHILEFDYRLVRIATIAVMVMWNFFLYKYWVYREERGTGNGE